MFFRAAIVVHVCVRLLSQKRPMKKKKKKKTTTTTTMKKKAALRFCNIFDPQIFGADFDSLKVRAGALFRVFLPSPHPSSFVSPLPCCFVECGNVGMSSTPADSSDAFVSAGSSCPISVLLSFFFLQQRLLLLLLVLSLQKFAGGFSICVKIGVNLSAEVLKGRLCIGFFLSVSLYLLSLGWSVFFNALQSITCLSFMYASLKTKNCRLNCAMTISILNKEAVSNNWLSTDLD